MRVFPADRATERDIDSVSAAALHSHRFTMNVKTVVGVVLMVGFTSLLFLNFGEQVGGYMDFAKAKETGSRAHVIGQWVESQRYSYDPEKNLFTFHMKDKDGNVRRVVYPNPKPANFEQAEELVIQGQIQGDVFRADHILVKCPSKYNDARRKFEQANSEAGSRSGSSGHPESIPMERSGGSNGSGR